MKVNGRHLPRMISNLINVFKLRDKARPKYRTTRDPADWEAHKLQSPTTPEIVFLKTLVILNSFERSVLYEKCPLSQ